jgi:hypothetical protein
MAVWMSFVSFHLTDLLEMYAYATDPVISNSYIEACGRQFMARLFALALPRPTIVKRSISDAFGQFTTLWSMLARRLVLSLRMLRTIDLFLYFYLLTSSLACVLLLACFRVHSFPSNLASKGKWSTIASWNWRVYKYYFCLSIVYLIYLFTYLFMYLFIYVFMDLFNLFIYYFWK